MIQPGANVYTQGFGSRPENIEVPHYDVRAPNTTDIIFPVGKFWVWPNNALWFLSGITSIGGVKSADWIQISGSDATLTIDANTGTATPVFGNMNIFGIDGVTTSASGDTVTIGLTGGGEAIDSLTPNSGTTPVIPDSNGNITLQGTGSITTVGGTNSLTPSLTGLTNHAVLVGAGTATITKVGPSATVGLPLVSAGSSADPLFAALTVPGGGTGDVDFTVFAPICGGSSTTGALLSASTGMSNVGYVLTSTGSSTLPSFQAVPFPDSIEQIDTQSGNITPTAGVVTIDTLVVAAGSNPIGTTGVGSTVTINAQISQAIAAPDADNIGLSNFNSADFSVDSDGFVSLVASPAIVTGTFTPAVSFNGDSTGITYSAQEGVYTVIGTTGTGSAICFCCFNVNLTDKGSANGDAAIGGFPFTFVNGIATSGSVGPFYCDGIAPGTGYGSIFGLTENADNEFLLFASQIEANSSPLQITDALFTNSTSFSGSIVYRC